QNSTTNTGTGLSWSPMITGSPLTKVKSEIGSEITVPTDIFISEYCTR
ncbi:2825_t:CDS:1, partial [Racocetra fulgida]